MRLLIALIFLLNFYSFAFSELKALCKIVDKNAFVELKNYKQIHKSDLTNSTLIKKEFITSVNLNLTKEISTIIITTNEMVGQNAPSRIVEYKMEFEGPEIAQKIYDDLSAVVTETKK